MSREIPGGGLDGNEEYTGIDHNSRSARRSPTAKRGESTSVIARHPKPNARHFSLASRTPRQPTIHTVNVNETQQQAQTDVHT